MIIDHTNRRVLEILENRDQATVTAYFQKARAEGLLAHMTEVTCDMWDGTSTPLARPLERVCRWSSIASRW